MYSKYIVKKPCESSLESFICAFYPILSQCYSEQNFVVPGLPVVFGDLLRLPVVVIRTNLLERRSSNIM